MLVYTRKRKRNPPGPDVALPPDEVAAPPKKLKAPIRTKSVTNSSRRPPPGTSLILWDLQIHTTDVDVLETFRKERKPTPVISFISRNNYTTRYTWCCRLQMASVNEASEILKKKTYTVKGVKARVTKEKGSEGSEVVQGKYKLFIRQMNYRSTKAFRYLRSLFQHLSCADIEIMKGEVGGGSARLRFRTKKGRMEAIRILKNGSNEDHKDWTFVVNDGVDVDDE